MHTLLSNKIGRLRLIGMLEGTSLLILTLVAVPLKHLASYDAVSANLGPIHGALFLLYIINTISVAVEYNWKFTETTWKVLIACIVPFGTFYIDRKILKPLYNHNIS